MSGNLGRLNIELALNQVNFQENLTKAQNRARKFSDRTVEYLNNIEKAANSLNKINSRLFNFNVAKSSITTLIQYADANTELRNRIKLVTESSTEQAKAIADVYDISLKTFQSSQATASVYSKFSSSAKELGLNLNDVAALTETVNKSIALSGVSAASAEAGLLQFGQALDKGRLNGQELASVMTQTPALAKAIADGLGVPTSALKEMGEKGELTTEKIISALQKMNMEINRQFASTDVTVSNALTNLRTQAEKWIGETNKGIRSTQSLAQGINALANNFDYLAKAAGGLAVLGIYAKYLRPQLNNYVDYRNQLRAAEERKRSEQQQALAISQTTQANFAKIKSEYELAKAEIANIGYARQQIVAERELLVAKMQSATSNSERAAITAQILALRQQEIAMTKLQTQAEQQLIAVKSSMKVAYAENAIAQSAYAASTVKVTAASQTFAAISKAVRAELTMLKTALLTSPLGALMGAVMLAGTAWSMFSSNTDSAKQALENFNAEVELSKEKLEQMNKAQLDAAKIKVQQQIEEQEQKIAGLRKEYEKLEYQIKHHNDPVYDAFGGVVYNAGLSQEELAKKSDEAKLKLGEVSDETEKLTNLMQILGRVNAQVAGAGLDGGAKSSQKVLDIIGNAQLKIQRSKLKGKDLAAFNADQALKGLESDPRYKEARDLFIQAELAGMGKTGGRGKKSGGSKTDYVKQYTEQITQMQQRLAELKANAQDIVLFGQSSQYQEVNKLTQDIAANAEKYAHFGKEGLAKLKEMATQIDSANQQVAISQFTFDNTEKLEAMEFELTLLGRTRQEQELMQYNHQLDLEAAKLKIGMTEENIAKLDEEIAKLKERRAEIQKQSEEVKGNAMLGFQQGMQTIEDQVSNVAGNISNLTVSAFGTMSDALTDFVMTGKADFSAMAKSIIRDIVQMTVRMLFFRAISSAFGGFSSVDIGSAPVAGAATNLFGTFDSGGYTGDGGKYQPAGIVHRGEYVITKEATARLGRGFLDQLNYGAVRRGFANGGGVGVPRLPSINYDASRSSGNISVKVINNGEPMEANVTQKQRNGQMEITVELMRQIARVESNEVIQQNMRAGGIFAR
ncbi:hypothetical protein BKK52_00950 [Rodentibacter trehalosifermentans]|uniref:Phage tail tape measure protein n=1 Tax=Rodentibacter trehalosifermentans TaxID=1908263 RepID=A0A1V3J750_9PAST|nr:tape measure protein [Rodentibacter trehalosifermentans]OOF50749.1 hypothetical protein BKK52_00950 [Rodentibacter trehalosifermentans]